MENHVFNENRRSFLLKAVPLATFMCFGCKRAAFLKKDIDIGDNPTNNIKMTTEEAYSYFLGTFIPLLKALASELGNERFLSIIANASSEYIVQGVSSITKDYEKTDLKAYRKFLKEVIESPPYNTALKYEITEESDETFEVKYTECLVAKAFKEMNATDIGYIIDCSSTKSVLKAFDPRIIYSNPLNIMKGDSICVERFTYQT